MAFTSVATSLTHIISVTPCIADFISAYTSIRDFISFPTPMSITDYISEATSIFPNTPIKRYKVYVSFLAFLSPPPLSLSLSLSLFFLAFGFFGFNEFLRPRFNRFLLRPRFNRFLWLRFIRCTSKKLRFVLRKDLQRECQYRNYADAKCDSQY